MVECEHDWVDIGFLDESDMEMPLGDGEKFYNGSINIKKCQICKAKRIVDACTGEDISKTLDPIIIQAIIENPSFQRW